MRSAIWCGLYCALVALPFSGCDDGGGPSTVVDGGDIDMAVDEADAAVDDMDEGLVDQDAAPDTGADSGVEADLGEADGAPPEPNPCEPCESDDDCAPEGARCIAVGDGDFCGQACAEDDDCPAGFSCLGFEEGSDQCVPNRGTCDACEDLDGDGYGVGPGCLGMDCDEMNAEVHEGAMDLCDGVNNDCDDATDEGFMAESCGVGACAAQSTCTDGAVVECTPAAPAGDDSTCDGLDDDCDGNSDEGYQPEACGAGPCAAASSCADGVETGCEPLPAPSEDDATCDGVDSDCDSLIDEDFVGSTCGEGACGMVGLCVDGGELCTPGEPLAADDATCNGVDEDCDGTVDEDFVTDVQCGLGVCRTAGACTDGDLVCVPLDVAAETDSNCDEVDEDCDGVVDEDCQQNFLGFALADAGDDFVDVDVTFEQVHSPANNGNFWLPRLVELRVVIPPQLTLRQPNQEGVIAGQAAVDAGKNVRVAGNDDRGLRILVFSQANTNRIRPGQILQLRFTKEPAINGPFPFSFNGDETFFAPIEANEVLEFRDAMLP